ncbi:MAG: DUF413 domain-containing protein [Succinivibrio sp.]|jgi:hypothetical protein|nr:DUF413 domain-containing protein [Succinivibrio sp.]MBR1612246.1 DUF413 domain-containing protein [Succinivibrio sp.]
MSFESEKPFNDFQHFARGIRRSGDFTINESNLLEKCGTAMMELYKGERKPKTPEEKEFVKQITSNEVITDHNAKIFKKYLQVIAPRHLHRLCNNGEEEMGNSFMGGSSSDETNLD